MTSKEYTKEEVRLKFLDHIRMLVNYWDSEVYKETTKERLEGLAFSILGTIDGTSVDLPSFILAPTPHKDDKEFNIKCGEDYYPENEEANCDIGGSLHELFYKKD